MNKSIKANYPDWRYLALLKRFFKHWKNNEIQLFYYFVSIAMISRACLGNLGPDTWAVVCPCLVYTKCLYMYPPNPQQTKWNLILFDFLSNFLLGTVNCVFVHPVTHCVIVNFTDHSGLFSTNPMQNLHFKTSGWKWNPVGFSFSPDQSMADRAAMLKVTQFSISSLCRCSFSVHAEQRGCSAVWGQGIWGRLPLLVCWPDCSERSVSFLIAAQELKGNSIGSE